MIAPMRTAVAGSKKLAKRMVRRAIQSFGYDLVPFDPELAFPIAAQRPFSVVEDLPLPEITGIKSLTSLVPIVEAPEFRQTSEFFSKTPPWSQGLVSSDGLALLYHATRLLRPAAVLEIGTLKGWTTQVLARAVEANRHGVVHTVGPYDNWRFSPLLKQWPTHLTSRVKFYATNSAAFFQQNCADIAPYDLIFVDGNHEYEFALFDLQCAARVTAPNGYIFVDDANQPEVAAATADFLAKHQEWRSCSSNARSDILDGQDLLILRRA
jgi:predicted O-methyltransferase YrrM